MVLHHKVQQHSGLFFNGRVQFNAVPGLINLSDGAMEGSVFFVAEEFAFAEFRLNLNYSY